VSVDGNASETRAIGSQGSTLERGKLRFFIHKHEALIIATRLEGNTAGLKPSQMKALTRLGQRRYPVQGGYTTEQARELALLSRALGRQVGLVIDRQGKVDMVIVGDSASILIPELPRGRGAAGRLRGIRLMHTHLSPDGLSQEDLMDMLFLRLDSVSVLTVNDYGDPVSFQSGQPASPQRGQQALPHPPHDRMGSRGHRFQRRSRLAGRGAWPRALRSFGGGGQPPGDPRIRLSPPPRHTGNAHRRAPGVGAQRSIRGDRDAYPAGSRHPSPAYFG